MYCNYCRRHTEPVEETDWEGDPGVVGGMHRITLIVCEWCGNGGDLTEQAPEEECDPEGLSEADEVRPYGSGCGR